MASSRGGRLSIGEVADVAGVTTRTVRHYHSIGLLPEPPRDSSGYRRYDGRDVIALVRVTRLRALGMPLPQIATRVADDGGPDVSLAHALRALADEVDEEIARLTATRDRLHGLAASEAFEQPAKALTQVLQERGILGPSDELRAAEGWAAALLDALHPQGMSGVLSHASELLADPDALAALARVRRRLSQLSDRTTDAEVSALAAEVAALLTRSDSDELVVDIDLMDVLLSDRMNSGQRRFMDQLRVTTESRR